jgi:hypothetical protein
MVSEKERSNKRIGILNSLNKGYFFKEKYPQAVEKPSTASYFILYFHQFTALIYYDIIGIKAFN